jgi:ParB-like chromosome segregation protein Spo0J
MPGTFAGIDHRRSPRSAASIREWGWTVPILIDDANVIIAGHGRVLAAERSSARR